MDCELRALLLEARLESCADAFESVGILSLEDLTVHHSSLPLKRGQLARLFRAIQNLNRKFREDFERSEARKCQKSAEALGVSPGIRAFRRTGLGHYVEGTVAGVSNLTLPEWHQDFHYPQPPTPTPVACETRMHGGAEARRGGIEWGMMSEGEQEQQVLSQLRTDGGLAAAAADADEDEDDNNQREVVADSHGAGVRKERVLEYCLDASSPCSRSSVLMSSSKPSMLPLSTSWQSDETMLAQSAETAATAHSDDIEDDDEEEEEETKFVYWGEENEEQHDNDYEFMTGSTATPAMSSSLDVKSSSSSSSYDTLSLSPPFPSDSYGSSEFKEHYIQHLKLLCERKRRQECIYVHMRYPHEQLGGVVGKVELSAGCWEETKGDTIGRTTLWPREHFRDESAASQAPDYYLMTTNDNNNNNNSKRSGSTTSADSKHVSPESGASGRSILDKIRVGSVVLCAFERVAFERKSEDEDLEVVGIEYFWRRGIVRKFNGEAMAIVKLDKIITLDDDEDDEDEGDCEPELEYCLTNVQSHATPGGSGLHRPNVVGLRGLSIRGSMSAMIVVEEGEGPKVTPKHEWPDSWKGDDGQEWRVGDMVYARWNGSWNYYVGRVCHINPDFTYGVDFDDGDIQDVVYPCDMSRAPPGPPSASSSAANQHEDDAGEEEDLSNIPDRYDASNPIAHSVPQPTG